MPVTDIKEIRLLPPLAIARFGSSPKPMENYSLGEPASPTGYRKLVPEESLAMENDRLVRKPAAASVTFRDGNGLIRPVCPFWELWARFEDDGQLEPLTKDHLDDLKLPLSSIQWKVSLGNIKAFRRTGDSSDRIEVSRFSVDPVFGNDLDNRSLSAAFKTLFNGRGYPLTNDLLIQIEVAGQRWKIIDRQGLVQFRAELDGNRLKIFLLSFSHHRPVPLLGEADNFKPGKHIPMGSIQFVPPNDELPEIRIRYTPAAGKVYGPSQDDPNLADDVYDSQIGIWDNHNDGTPGPNTPPITQPGGIYARALTGANAGDSLGYLDDSCDGWIECSITVNGQTHTDAARVSAGPPDFVPDSKHVRTVDDDLAQMINGVDVTSTLDADTVISIGRRALETMRGMFSPWWNEFYGGPFSQQQANYVNARGRHENFVNRLEGLKANPGTEARNQAIGALTQILITLREYTDVANRTFSGTPFAKGHLQMPALMRGSDSHLLALTRRQRAIIEKAVDQFSQARPTPQDEMLQLIATLQGGAAFHTVIPLDNGGQLSDLFANPPQLLQYLRDASAKGSQAGSQLGKKLVVDGKPDDSAFLNLLKDPNHTMHPIFQNATVNGKSGIAIVQSWIESLP